MSHVTIRPGEAGATKVAQGLLATAAALGLPADVVVWSPSLGGFKVPELVATTYAGVEDPDAVPDVGEPEDGTTEDAAGGADEQVATQPASPPAPPPGLSPFQVAVEDPDAVPDVGEPEDGTTEDAAGGADEQVATQPASPPAPPPGLSPFQVAAAAAEASTPRRYSDEEKAAAVAAVLTEGRTIASVAEELGASATSVSRWVTEAKAEGGAV